MSLRYTRAMDATNARRRKARRLAQDSLQDPHVAPIPLPAPAPRRDDAAMLLRLTESTIVAHEQIPQGSNYSFIVGMSDSGTDIDLLGVYKPRRGEVPLWDFPSGTLYKRELAAYLASVALGWQYIPPTVIRDGPYGQGSVQQYIKPAQGRHFFEWQGECPSHLMRLAVFDYLTNNADRKSGHVFLDEEGSVWAIDHGLTFNVDPKLRTVIRGFTGEELPEWLHTELQAFRADAARTTDLDQQLGALLDEPEVNAFAVRLDRVLNRRIFPRLDRYDSVPREWW